MVYGDIFVPSETVLRIYLLFLYATIGALAYRWLLPNLSLALKWYAAAFFVVQLSLIFYALGTIQSELTYEYWFWSLNREWNIFAYLASAQLATVAGVALLAAWRGRSERAAQRIYFLSIGLLFLFMALDEFFLLHEAYPTLMKIYPVLGLGILALSVFAARYSPRDNLKWFACMLSGLFIAGFGEIVVEEFKSVHICGYIWFVRISRCLEAFYLEETLAFSGIWLSLVAVLGHFSNLAPRPRPWMQRITYILPLLWIVCLHVFSSARYSTAHIDRMRDRTLSQPASLSFEGGLRVDGFRLTNKARHIAVIMHLPDSAFALRLGYSIHLVDQISGASIAASDNYVTREDKVSINKDDFMAYFRQTVELDIPPEAPTNNAFWLLFSLWREESGNFLPQKILSSDLPLMNDAQVVLDELVLPVDSAAPASAPLASFDNGFALEAVQMPGQVQRGQTLNITFTWRADKNGEDNYLQFLHLGNEDTGEWFVYDQSPLGARLPTRLWYSGLADSETWKAPLPADIAPGRYAVFTGLYRASDLERVPVTDADGTPWLDNRVALGNLIIQRE